MDNVVRTRQIGFSKLNPLPPSDAVRKQKKNILEYLFSSVLAQLKKYHPYGNLKFNNLGICQKLKIAKFNGKNPSNFPRCCFEQFDKSRIITKYLKIEMSHNIIFLMFNKISMNTIW